MIEMEEYGTHLIEMMNVWHVNTSGAQQINILVKTMKASPFHLKHIGYPRKTSIIAFIIPRLVEWSIIHLSDNINNIVTLLVYVLYLLVDPHCV